jgi:hypothetical protein
MTGKAIAFTTPGSSPSTGLLGDLLGAAPNLQKAVLELHEPPPDGKTSGKTVAKLDTIDFLFNPKEVSFTKTAKWNRQNQPAAGSSPPPDFGGADPATLTVEMFLDATGDMSDKVVGIVERLMKACVPTPSSLSKTPTAPFVLFRWGSLLAFPAVVKSVNGKFTLFTPDGVPVRATVTVAMEEISGEITAQNPTSGARTATSMHVLVDGDTLASVAYKHYGNANFWRAIAEANDIDDPMRLPVGTALLVPELAELRHG